MNFIGQNVGAMQYKRVNKVLAVCMGCVTVLGLVAGIGMVARGEVALMVAQKGIDAGMINPAILPAVILSVICCAVLTPVMLEKAISKGPELN